MDGEERAVGRRIGRRGREEKRGPLSGDGLGSLSRIFQHGAHRRNPEETLATGAPEALGIEGGPLERQDSAFPGGPSATRTASPAFGSNPGSLEEPSRTPGFTTHRMGVL